MNPIILLLENFLSISQFIIFLLSNSTKQYDHQSSKSALYKNLCEKWMMGKDEYCFVNWWRESLSLCSSSFSLLSGFLEFLRRWGIGGFHPQLVDDVADEKRNGNERQPFLKIELNRWTRTWSLYRHKFGFKCECGAPWMENDTKWTMHDKKFTSWWKQRYNDSQLLYDAEINICLGPGRFFKTFSHELWKEWHKITSQTDGI